ncbi:NACHT domain-containing NTPase [Microcoleus sp. FACHB-831]|uniref:NACHT domain-containing protein n=1 Tax=Microcoleus sp. FACHB-831 TaxID=2692827 RepID=UPI00168804F7|nr:NACHT domain-containing NTPase [Microcoleus sp. FACHB-831]MBD1920858.1 NACHT domain-containing NTPase [Microcoleus sp. FACHB-831]
MARRSLLASSDGIEKIKSAFKRKKWTREFLAGKAGCSRQTIWSLLKGNSIDCDFFMEICSQLGLDWEEIAEPDLAEPTPKNTVNIDALVQELREKIKPSIQERCGTMRVLDMTQPIGLNDIYTNVNILEKITGLRRKEITELLQNYNSEDFDRFGLGRVTEERVPGLDAVSKYNKLMILGKPGAGKTTFLKHIAIQCIGGEFQAKRVPIFVTLKDFSETANQPTLLKYIRQQFSAWGDVERLHAPSLDEVINHGRALVLLDGLDEVREEDHRRVLKEIRELSAQFRDNQFVITCRIAAREHTFDKFTDVEVADFDKEQISTFAHNWFKNKAVKADIFIKYLKDNEPIQELATNPLLLTLLCLVFEESGDFPANRSELYKEGLDALLKKWDANRGIYRDQVYKKLSVQRKEELLSKIALTTFEGGEYFFKQKVAEQYITDYIRNLPDANTDPEALQIDSELVLRSIEYQHGLLVERAKRIYSFSHLTFHEYFTAREIVVVKQSSEDALQNLVSHITDKRWREVFLLAVGMSPSADRLLLLMKEKVDALVADDEKLQHFLSWANQKSLSLQLPYTAASVRAFYLCLEDADTFIDHLFIDNSLDFADALGLEHLESYVVECGDASLLQNGLGLDLALYRTLDIGLSAGFSPENALADDLDNVLNNHQLEPELKRALQQLKDELPDSNKNEEGFNKWWKDNGDIWGKKLNVLMINYRDIAYNWPFSYEQEKNLAEYYEATLLLMECLDSDCYASVELRYQIEDTLLLPIAEIEKRKAQLV